jgi:hypothetical protein
LRRIIDAARVDAQGGTHDALTPLAPDTLVEAFGARCRLGDVFPALGVEDALKCAAVLEILHAQEKIFQN